MGSPAGLEPGSIVAMGESAVIVEVSGPVEAAALARRLRRLLGTDAEVTSGLSSVLIEADRFADLVGFVGHELRRPVEGEAEPARHHEIEVVLDGEDLAEALVATGLDLDGLRRALEVELAVATVGFSPGFGYLTGIHGPLAQLPRRSTPRPSVPVGSLAVAAGMAALYPQATPGGWWLLGRTVEVLFDQYDDDRPSRLEPGDTVALTVVSEHHQPFATSARRPFTPPSGATPVLEVLATPPATAVVDAGRRGAAHLGVPRGGPADPERAAVAQALVGGGPGSIEVSGRGFEALVLASTVVAGVDLELRVDARPVPAGVPLAVAAGQVLEVTGVGRGGRGYLGVAGGPEIPAVLGSMSTDSLARVGPGHLEAGDQIGGGDPPGTLPVRGSVPEDPSPAVLRFTAGCHVGMLTEPIEGLRGTVSPTSNRVGLRIDCAPLARHEGEVASLPTVAGAIQLPPDGHPIILGPDHATLGGYPIVGVVIGADLAILGRLSPGDPIELVEVSIDQARSATALRAVERRGFVSGTAPTLTSGS